MMSLYNKYKKITSTLIALTLTFGLFRVATATPVALPLNQNDDIIFATIDRVDDHAFPQMTLYLSIEDNEGWPITNEEDLQFKVMENNTPIPSENITVSKNERQFFGLVLAIDISVPKDTMAEMKAAAKNFLNSLQTEDQIAIIAYNEEIQLAQDFTNDHDLLNKTIDALEEKGRYSALNETVIQATELTRTLPTGRHAIVFLAECANNIGDISNIDAVSEALKTETPIYTIGIGPKVRPDDLRTLAKLTGGQSFILDKPTDIGKSLNTIAENDLLHEGYKLIYTSNIKADDELHDITVNVTYKDSEAQTKSEFLASSGKVDIQIPDLKQGQTVGGTITLEPNINAPGEIISVEYILDGEPLEEIQAPPFSIEWDSTSTSPGPHLLNILVTDLAGNEGSNAIWLNIAIPIEIDLSLSTSEATIGDEIQLEATVNALSELEEVEFLVDKKSAGSVNSPPFQLALDTTPYDSGSHTITVQATDTLGHTAQASQKINLLPIPVSEPEPEWVHYGKLAGIIIAILILLILAIILPIILIAWQRKRFTKHFQLKVSNLGNLTHSFILEPDNEENLLKFYFSHKGINLHKQTIEKSDTIQAPSSQKSQAATVTRASATTETRPSPPQKTIQKTTASQNKPAPKEAFKKVGFMANTVSTILGILGTMLPKSMGGNAMRNASMKLRGGQSAVNRQTRIPRSIASRGRSLNQQVSQLSPSQSTASSRNQYAPPKKTRIVQETVEEPASPQSGAIKTHHQQTAQPVSTTSIQTTEEFWALTPPVKPGETLMLDLQIKPLKRNSSSQEYLFSIQSYPAKADNPPTETNEYSTTIPGFSALRDILLPLIPTAAIIVVEVFLIRLLLISLGYLG